MHENPKNAQIISKNYRKILELSMNPNTSPCTIIITNNAQNIDINISTVIFTMVEYSPISGKYPIPRAYVHVHVEGCGSVRAPRAGRVIERERGSGREMF